MSALELTVEGSPAEPAVGWTFSWIDQAAGIARLGDGSRSELCLVEGSGSEWVVTLRGRRIPVTVRSWRERVLADAESAARQAGGPVEIRATLPGLVVGVAVEDGAEVGEGTILLTIEAMKMQNEVRAPRAGRVSNVSVAAGHTVLAGATLLRIE
jgi:acetyl/propionyl-CoA carboxylase alpha subunit